MKRLFYLTIVAMMLGFYASADLAAQGGDNNRHRGNNGDRKGNTEQHHNFVDEDGDGVCDNFIDEDGDGECDRCANGEGHRKGRGWEIGNGHRWGMGNGHNGMGFTDEDGDGVCDNFIDEDGDGECDHCNRQAMRDYRQQIKEIRRMLHMRNGGQNPIIGSTSFSFEIDEDSQVTVELYRGNGDLVQEIFSGALTAGTHTMDVDGSDLAPGSYFILIRAGGQTISRHVIITR